MNSTQPNPTPATKNDSIAVLLADDHTVVREGFRRLFEGVPGFRVVGEASSGREAVQLAWELRPDIVVMDIAMPLLNGLEATRQIRKTVPGVRVLILSAYSDEPYVERAMQSGAAGFLLKQTSMSSLCKAVREVCNGVSLFDPVAARMLRPPGSLPPTVMSKPEASRLSPRELEVLQLIAEGKANKETAAELGICVKTVEKHRANLMAKLKIRHTAGLTRYAVAAGFIEPGGRQSIGE